jgi:mRNA interferase YafQ
MREIRRVSQFKKDYKRCGKRGYDIEQLHGVIEFLVNGKKVPAKFDDHALLGEYKDCCECHLGPDWLLVYQLTATELVLVRTGTHSDLFE